MRCRRKLGFHTLEQAERTAAIVSKQRAGAGKTPVRVYDCPECGLLHFSSKSEAEVSRPSTVEHIAAPEPHLTGRTTTDVHVQAWPDPNAPTPPPDWMVKGEPPPKPKLSGAQKALVETQARLSATKADLRWMKERVRRAHIELKRGNHRRAAAMLYVLEGLPENFAPSTRGEEADRYLEERVEERMWNAERGAA